MKQRIIEIGEKKVIFQEVPEDSRNYSLDEDQDLNFSIKNRVKGCTDIFPADNYWKIIGIYPGLTEDQASKIFDPNSEDMFYSRLDTVEALLKREDIYTVNIHGDIKPGKDKQVNYPTDKDFKTHLSLWEIVEANRWQKIVILKEI